MKRDGSRRILGLAHARPLIFSIGYKMWPGLHLVNHLVMYRIPLCLALPLADRCRRFAFAGRRSIAHAHDTVDRHQLRVVRPSRRG